MGSGDPRQVDEALSLIDLNLKENPSSFEDQRSRAIVLSLKPGRHDEAIGTLEDLQKTGLLSKQDRFLLARLHAQNRGWSRCRNLMFGLLSGHAPEAGHVAFYVNQLIDRNELDEAEQLLQRFRTAYTNSGDVRLLTEANLRLCKARKHDDESLALVENFSRANPDQKGAAAEFYEQSGFPRRAEQAYRAFVAQNAREPLRELALAGFLGRQNRTEEALTLCENAWKTCPPEPVAATSVAILAAGKNVSDEQDHRVEGWLESALRGPSAPPSLRLCMARLCSTRQRYDQTESIYREVLTGSPNNLEVLNNLAWLLAFQSGKEQEALRAHQPGHRSCGIGRHPARYAGRRLPETGEDRPGPAGPACRGRAQPRKVDPLLPSGASPPDGQQRGGGARHFRKPNSGASSRKTSIRANREIFREVRRSLARS